MVPVSNLFSGYCTGPRSPRAGRVSAPRAHSGQRGCGGDPVAALSICVSSASVLNPVCALSFLSPVHLSRSAHAHRPPPSSPSLPLPLPRERNHFLAPNLGG